MGKAPVLQCVGRRPAAVLDIGQHLDGGGKTCARSHCGLLKTGMTEMNHITSRKRNPSVLSLSHGHRRMLLSLAQRPRPAILSLRCQTMRARTAQDPGVGRWPRRVDLIAAFVPRYALLPPSVAAQHS